MLPYIYIGQLKIPTYYTAMVLGYVMMIVFMLLPKRRQKYGLSWVKSVIFATAELFFGILGCKILFLLENITRVRQNGFTFGGFSFYGAVFLIPLMMPLVGKALKLSLRDSLNSSAICIVAMLGTIRMGCFLNGCCGGRVFHIGEYYFSLPTQLIEFVFDLLILSLLLRCEKKGNDYGSLYPKFLLWYGSVRFLIEFVRNTEKDWLYLSHAHWFSAAAIIIGGLLEIVRIKQSKADRTPPDLRE